MAHLQVRMASPAPSYCNGSALIFGGQNVALLDYPFHIAVIGDIVTTLVLNLLESVMDHVAGGLETLKGLRLVVIAWAILASG